MPPFESDRVESIHTIKMEKGQSDSCEFVSWEDTFQSNAHVYWLKALIWISVVILTIVLAVTIFVMVKFASKQKRSFIWHQYFLYIIWIVSFIVILV